MERTQVLSLANSEIARIKSELRRKGIKVLEADCEDMGLIGFKLTVHVEHPQGVYGTYPTHVTCHIEETATHDEVIAEIDNLIKVASNPIDPEIAAATNFAAQITGAESVFMNDIPGGMTEVMLRLALAGTTLDEFMLRIEQAKTDPKVLKELEAFLGQDLNEMIEFFQAEKQNQPKQRKGMDFSKKKKRKH